MDFGADILAFLEARQFQSAFLLEMKLFSLKIWHFSSKNRRSVPEIALHSLRLTYLGSI